MFLRFRDQSAKKTCLRVAIFNFSEKLQNIFEIGLKNMECSYKNRSHCKNISKEKFRRKVFVVFVLIYPMSKLWRQSDKLPMCLSFLQCPFQVKKLIQENSAKYVNQTGNFFFWPKFKLPFLCQYLIRSMISFFALEISFGSLLFNRKK